MLHDPAKQMDDMARRPPRMRLRRRKKKDDPYCEYKDDHQRTLALLSKHRWEFYGKVVSAVALIAIAWIASSSPVGMKLVPLLLAKMSF